MGNTEQQSITLNGVTIEFPQGYKDVNHYFRTIFLNLETKLSNPNTVSSRHTRNTVDRYVANINRCYEAGLTLENEPTEAMISEGVCQAK